MYRLPRPILSRVPLTFLSDKARSSSSSSFPLPSCLSFKPFNFLFASWRTPFTVTRDCFTWRRPRCTYIRVVVVSRLVAVNNHTVAYCARWISTFVSILTREEPTSRVTRFVFRLSLRLRSRIRCPLRFPPFRRSPLIVNCYRNKTRQ